MKVGEDDANAVHNHRCYLNSRVLLRLNDGLARARPREAQSHLAMTSRGSRDHSGRLCEGDQPQPTVL